MSSPKSGQKTIFHCAGHNKLRHGANLAGIAAQIGYKRRPGQYGGKPAVVADNTLDRQFEVDAPDVVWVTDIT